MQKYPVTSPYVMARSRLDLGLYIPVPLPFLAHPDLQRNGKPNLLALLVLADVLNWYRPLWEEDVGENGEVVVRAWQRFPGEALILNYEHLSQKFGYSVRAVKEAVYFLARRGLVHLRTVTVRDELTGEVKGKYTEIMPDLERITAILSPEVYTEAEPPEGVGEETTDAHEDVRRYTDAHEDVRRPDAHTDAHTDAHEHVRQLQIDRIQIDREQKSIKAEGGRKSADAKNLSRRNLENPKPQTTREDQKAEAGPPAHGTAPGPEPREEVAPEADVVGQVLRDLGLPGRYRRRLAKALQRGEVTPEDLVAELARCYRDWERGRVERPVLAAAASLLRGNRAPREFYDPARQRFPQDVAALLEQAGWLTVEGAEEDPEEDLDALELLVEKASLGPEPSAETEREDDLFRLWKRVLALFRDEMSPASFQRYLQPAWPVALEDDVLTIVAPNAYTRDWLESRLTNGLKRKLMGLLGRQVDVRFVVANSIREEVTP